jgi:hypothetical protein
VVGCTSGSREEVPGERKPVTRVDNDDDDDLQLQALKILTRLGFEPMISAYES